VPGNGASLPSFFNYELKFFGSIGFFCAGLCAFSPILKHHVFAKADAFLRLLMQEQVI
jgi:hypothetical protein